MQWLVEPRNVEPNDACMGYTCIDRAEPCTDKNPCVIKLCSTRFCYKNY